MSTGTACSTAQNERGRKDDTHPGEDYAHQIANGERVVIVLVGSSDPPAPEHVPHNSAKNHDVIEVGNGMSSQQIHHNSTP